MVLITNPPQATADERYMALALEAAQAGLGWTSPNPMVGCVIVRNDEVLSVGAHLRDGEEHAEALALADVNDAAGTTAYVTLEPCTHIGRQPACSTALIAAGVSRVVYGSQDVDPRTKGAAISVLGEAGITVTPGVLKAECDRFLDCYLHATQTKRVFVHLKLALSLDAKMACKTGHSKWLSCPTSLGYAHYLRQKYDAVLVGSGTVSADNPRLTARRDTMAPYFELPDQTLSRNPVRVILDTNFGLDENPSWEFLKTDEGNFRKHLPRVVTFGSTHHLKPHRKDDDRQKIVQIGLSERSDGRPDLSEMPEQLWASGIRSLLVEGGSKVAQEFISQGLVDKVSIVFTPRILGGDAMGFSPEMGLQTVGDGLRLTSTRCEMLGTDTLISGYLAKYYQLS